jgi:rod shape-determining protein MreC
METSRDDFIIAIRSAFLKKGTQQRFSLLGLISFSIIFLVLGSFNFKAVDYVKIVIKEVVYKSSFIISGPETFIKNNYLIVKRHLTLYEQNQKNELELESLRSKDLLNEFILLENKRLKTIVDDYLIISDEILAKILSDKVSPFLKSIIINKGSKHNVNLGMIVLDGEYLVGKVIEVNYLTARVLLLSDLNSKIPVIIEPSGILSILSGTGEDKAVIEYTKNNQTIKDGSIIYTSGTGELFKAGIPIGKTNKNNVDESMKVEFFSDFSQLKFIKILGFKKVEN